MGLLGNHSRFNFNVSRGWGVSPSLTPGNRNRGSNWYNWIRQSGATTVLSLVGKPSGYYAPGMYKQANIAGLISSSNQASGDSALVANLAGGLNGVAPLTGSASLTANLNALAVAVAALVASGNLTNANLNAIANIVTALTGSGDVTNAGVNSVINGIAALTGQGDITNASMQAALAAVASLTGSGGITNSNLSAALGAIAALTGSGDITNVNIHGAFLMLCAINGLGDLSNANLTALGDMLATVTGSATLTAAIKAYASIAASLNVTGGTLTVTDIAQAVWSQVADGTYTYAQMMEILTAIAAGKVSGGPDHPVFRNISDTKNVASGTADSNGNRTVVTLTP